MRSRRAIRGAAVVVAVVAIAMVGSACSSDGIADTPRRTDASTAGVGGRDGTAVVRPGSMFVLDSTQGSTDGSTVRFEGVDAWVTVFTDRPARTASRISIEDFVSSWASFGFAQDPPNAAIVFDADRDVVVTLREPRLVEEMRTSTIEFGYSVLDGQAALPASFAQPSLFVDSVGAPSTSTSVWGYSGTNGVSAEVSLTYIANDAVAVTGVVIPPPLPAMPINSYLTAFLFDGRILDASVAELTESDARAAVGEAIAKGPVSEVTSPIPYAASGRSMVLEAPIREGGVYTVVVVAAPVAGISRVDATTDALAVIEFSS